MPAFETSLKINPQPTKKISAEEILMGINLVKAESVLFLCKSVSDLVTFFLHKHEYQ